MSRLHLTIENCTKNQDGKLKFGHCKYDFYRNDGSTARPKWVLNNSFTGLYGQTLAQNGYTWPSSSRWSRWNASGSTLTFLDSFIFDPIQNYLDPNKTDTIRLQQRSPDTTATITHYKENLDGTWSEANEIKSGGGTFYLGDKYTGFTVAYYSTNGTTWHSGTSGQGVSYSTKLYIRHKMCIRDSFCNVPSRSKIATLLNSSLISFNT